MIPSHQKLVCQHFVAVFQITPVLPPEADKNWCGRTDIGPSPPCRTGNFGAYLELLGLQKSFTYQNLQNFVKKIAGLFSKRSLKNFHRYFFKYKMDVPIEVWHVIFSFQNYLIHVVILPHIALFKRWNYKISWGRSPRPPMVQFIHPFFSKSYHMQVVLVSYA